MAEDRPAKNTVRRLWIDRLVDADAEYSDADEPLYLTLCGALGKEIDLLIEAGVIELTEVGAVAVAHLLKVVAVEASPHAVSDLQIRFPGLKIIEQRIHDVLKISNPLAWPQGTHETYCRARVVNLDLDEPLKAVIEDGQLVFPVVKLVQKIAQVHAKQPRVEWTLYLTLHGEVQWAEDVMSGVRGFLCENFELEPEFAAASRDHLGDDVYQGLLAGQAIDWSSAPPREQQALLMALVPKRIAHAVHATGWLVKTVRNVRYGGEAPHAPMVTWIMEFEWDTRASQTPIAVYRDSLRDVLSSVGEIAEDGTLS